ncbi:MAG: signal recognition particle-docking protein FtsY [Candidatus Cloacimonadota bacterium]|nr:MAG: signal recognition particle-docking protein FtsY [Candidatus Cloacimonadota bacterium]
MSLLDKLRKKLVRTRTSFIGKISELVNLHCKIDEDLIEDIEEVLIQSDVGIQMSLNIIDKLKEELRITKTKDPNKIQDILENIIENILVSEYEGATNSINLNPEQKPYIIIFVGVNGVGKTTSIGKLAKLYKDRGKSVLLVAADTFRAAAEEQLEVWAKRVNVPIIKQKYGSDPSSVVYDGIISAKAKGYDIVLVDTAGRLHTKVNLMKELQKMVRTTQKLIPDAPHEILLVLDATTGQNGLVQARKFKETIPVSGIIIAKLDGTAKAGIVVGIRNELGIPVKLIGIGENIEDLKNFHAREFVKAIFQ